MALVNVSEFVRAESITEAFQLLNEPGARLVAGGIDVVLFPGDATKLIDITALPLSGIESEGDGIAIGATTTMTELIESPLIKEYLGGVIERMLHRVASPLQRNLGTVGGSLMIAHPWSDLITLFLVLGTRVVYFDGSEHEISLADFYAENLHRKKIILTKVLFPAVPRTAAAEFIKFSRTAFDIAILNCAAFVRAEVGRCVEVRIAVGGMPQRAVLLSRAAEVLMGDRLAPETVEQAARTAQAEAAVGDDMRASADYRRTLVKVGVARALSRIKEQLVEAT